MGGYPETGMPTTPMYLHAGPPNIGGGRVHGGSMLHVTGRSEVRRGSGGNATSSRAGGCHTCDMPVNGRDKAIVGSMGRRCVSTSSSLNTTYVTDYTSSIGRTSSSRGARSIGVSMPALSSAR